MTDRSITSAADHVFEGQGYGSARALEDGGVLAGDTGEVPLMGLDDRPRASYTLRVNGVERPVLDAWIGESLLYVLRERLGLAGAKDGCEQGECGACSVTLDGQLVDACLVAAALAVGSEIHTVEGLSADGAPSDVQRALADSGAVQCGYCAPGLAMALHDLLQRNHRPSDVETRQALCGNLCRCTGYQGVLHAARTVAEARRAQADADAAQAAEASAAAAQAAAEGGTARQRPGPGTAPAPEGAAPAGYQGYPGYDAGYTPVEADAHDTGPVYVQLPSQPGPADPAPAGADAGHPAGAHDGPGHPGAGYYAETPPGYPDAAGYGIPGQAGVPADEQPVYAEVVAQLAPTEGEQPYADPEQRYAGTGHYTEGDQRYGEGEQRYGDGDQRYAEGDERYTEGDERYGDPEQRYGGPDQGYADPGQAYAEPERRYGGEDEQRYAERDQGYADPGQGYAEAGRYADPEQGYARSEPGYAEPEQAGQPGRQAAVDPLFGPIDAVLGATGQHPPGEGTAGEGHTLGTYAPDPYGTAQHTDPYQADPYRQGHGNDGTIPYLHIPQELYGLPQQPDPGTPPHGTPLPPASPVEDGA